MAKMGDIRLKILKVTDARPHRYRGLRALSQTFSLLVLALVPLSGLARVDFWRGEHMLLFKNAPFKHALGGVIIGIGAMYVVTFLSNVIAGRLFCGWGCPVGQVSRFGDAVATPGKRGTTLLRQLQGAVFSGLFVLSVFAWWVDPRVLAFGSPSAMATAWSIVAIGTAGAYLHGKYWRWEFCKSVCPIGVYYSFVSPARYFGIHFRNEQASCIECDACDHVCPVDLKPRELALPVSDRRGVSLLDAPGFNHCLECGDCIQACEFMIDKRGTGPVPLHLGWFAGEQRVDYRQKREQVEAAAPAEGAREPGR